jgi:2-oxoisovalerate dehydrogenase E2 component (dihydrolipoyl transacylase)
MPQLKHFPLPDVGEGLTEAEILQWRVQPGDTVSLNQVIVEIETAKAAVELPCPYAGQVTELLAEPGQTVEVGAPIIAIDLDPGSAAPQAPPEQPSGGGKQDEEGADGRIATLVGYGPRTSTKKRRPRKKEPVDTAPAPRVGEEATAVGGDVPLAKPPVRKLAKDLGVDLGALRGSGAEGVITREDVERASGQAEPLGFERPAARERRVPIKGVRKATAQAVAGSAFTAPHVTEFLTIDVTPMMELRERLKSHPEFQGVKVTPLAFAAKAVCLAARRTPDVNATWDDSAEEIVYKDYVHLGIAAATPRGLVVPKIRDADRMSLRELASSLETLAITAREGKTAPADMLNGTMTITNVGVFGVDTGTPILNPGESAILAFGAIRDMPWVVDGQVVPRKVCQLALSFDHRVVDGQQGSQFLADVGALLADPSMAMTY